MKYCIYCKTTFNGDYCPHCGAVSNEPVPEKPKGRKGAIVRMVISGIIAAIMLLATISGFGSLNGFGEVVNGLLVGIGGMGLAVALVWVAIKWGCFAGSYSFRWAGNFWKGWHCYTIFGLYIKLCLTLLIGGVPVMLGQLLFSPCLMLLFGLADYSSNFFVMLLFALVSAAIAAACIAWDVCILRGIAPMDAFRRKLALRK